MDSGLSPYSTAVQRWHQRAGNLLLNWIIFSLVQVHDKPEYKHIPPRLPAIYRPSPKWRSNLSMRFCSTSLSIVFQLISTSLCQVRYGWLESKLSFSMRCCLLEFVEEWNRAKDHRVIMQGILEHRR